MKQLPQSFCWFALALLTLLYWRGVDDASAQSTNCPTETIVANCTFLPMVAGASSGGPVDNAPTETATSISAPTEEARPTEAATPTAEGTPTPSPTVSPTPASDEPTPTPATFDAIPVDGPPTDRQPHLHGDLNLSLRGYVATSATLELIDVNGPTDPNAPQLPGLFAEPRLPSLTAAFQIHDWDWACSEDGCRGQPIITPAVTMLEMSTSDGEAISIPSRGPEIFGGGYKALVLYAEAERITLTYLRQDTVAFGYTVHVESVQVDPALLALYQSLNEAGRGELPALRNGERLGSAIGTSIKVVIRDQGSFMDPRIRKNWWQGY